MTDALQHRQIMADVTVDGRWISDTECHQFVTYQKSYNNPSTGDGYRDTIITLDGDIDLGRFPQSPDLSPQTDIAFTIDSANCNFTDASGNAMVLDFPGDASSISFKGVGNPRRPPFDDVQASNSTVSFTDTDLYSGVYSYTLKVRCRYKDPGNGNGVWYIELDPRIVNPSSQI